MHSQFVYEDRKVIEKLLNGRQSFREIARQLGKHCTSVSREIQSHLVVKQTGAWGQRFNNCSNRFGCQNTGLCDAEGCRGGRCCSCHLLLCRKVCPDFELQICPRSDSPPYVCNGCTDRKKCSLEKHFYHAEPAQREADAVRCESRSGTHLAPKEAAHVKNIVLPLLKQGLSLHHIWASNKDTLMISKRTFRMTQSDDVLFHLHRFFRSG